MNMVHLLVEGPAMLEARPNIASKGPDFAGTGLSGSVEEYLMWGEDRRGVRDRRDPPPSPHSLKANIVISETCFNTKHLLDPY